VPEPGRAAEAAYQADLLHGDGGDAEHEPYQRSLPVPASRGHHGAVGWGRYRHALDRLGRLRLGEL
jgi:hypothetical protein